VLGALFQIGAGFAVADGVGRVSDQNSTLVVPAGYAFSIWGPIFLLSVAYAVYQALPQERTNPLLRRVGWLAAAAYLGNGAWELLFPAERYVLAQVLLVGIALCAVAALLGISRHARERGLSRAERWLVTLPVGLLAGWVTAAASVGFATTLVALGALSGGTGEALLGAALLLLAALVSAAVVLYARGGPPQGYVGYAAAVLWALVAVVVSQYDASFLTTAAAVVSAVPVVLALLRGRRAGSERRGGQGAQPRVV
jgi:hypothetical protein